MQVFDFRSEVVNSSVRLFPDVINQDPWILFHGTTNFSESDIEGQGFTWRAIYYDRQDVEAVVSIFQTLDWGGLGTDAFLALKAYSIAIDFESGEAKPTFFSDCAEATIGYTRRYRVGGETAGCLLYALQNLEAFLEDKNIREEFRRARFARLLNMVGVVDIPRRFSTLNPRMATAADCVALADYLEERVGHRFIFSSLSAGSAEPEPYVPWEEDLEWLESRVRSLAALKKNLEQLERNYTHGVVYAVRFEKGDSNLMRDLNNGLSHGFAHYGAIPPDRIVAKSLLSGKQERLNVAPRPAEILPRLRHGILGDVLPSDVRMKRIASVERMVVRWGDT